MHYQLPSFLAKAHAVLPVRPISLLSANVLNRCVLPFLPADLQLSLDQKVLGFVVRDAGLRVNVRFSQKRFVAVPQCQPDAVIQASAYDFYQLLTRKEDADTLFFNRRLVLQGDTELALSVKNGLDAIEPNDMLEAIPLAGKQLAKYMLR